MQVGVSSNLPFRTPEKLLGGQSQLTPAGQMTDPPPPAGHAAYKLDVGGGLCYTSLDINVEDEE